MAIFDYIPMGEEGLKEIYHWWDAWLTRNKGIIPKEVIRIWNKRKNFNLPLGKKLNPRIRH
jgi:hypothetical protein